MSWKRFTHGDCPVCNGARKDCRQSTLNNLVHCRNSEANPVDWAFLKTDILGFGIWAYKPDREAWNEERREEWRREQEFKRKQQEKQEQKRRKQSLSNIERDREIRKILSQLSLSERDRQRLKNRGFTDEQIQANHYRSVTKWQRLDWAVNPQLAGTHRNGKGLNNPCSGILCPVPNEEGLYVALRLHNPKSQENGLGKYIWLSSSKRGVDNKNQDGENPIAVYYPKECKCFDKIGLVEGLEFKSALAANRLGYPVIGFSGSNFASSPKTLHQAIQTITNQLWIQQQEAQLSNQSPPNSIFSNITSKETEKLVFANMTVPFLKSAECGQQSERNTPTGTSNGTIATQTLSGSNKIPITFVLLGDGGCLLNQQVLNGYDSGVKLIQSWHEQVNYAWWNQVEKSVGDIDEIYPEQIAKITHLSPEEFEELAKKEQYFHQLRVDWRKSKQFTADTVVRQRYFKWSCPQSKTASFIKSSTGTGKTTQLLKWLEELKDQGAIALGYRNTLLLQLCAQSGFYHLHEHDGAALIGWEQARIALCVDSLWRFKPEDFNGKVLIIDEVCSVIIHLLFSPTVSNREKILNLFAEALNRCDRLICLDGMMADWVVNYLMEFCQDKELQRVKNTWNNNKPVVNFLMGTIDVNGDLKVNDRSPWLEELLERAPVPAIGTDSQVTAESLDNLLTERGYNVLRIDSKTVHENYVKEFLTDCNAYLKKYKPDILIYTPSAESGVDVSITHYFTHHFCFFFGVLGVDAILQLIARIRDVDCPKYFWCREWVSLPDTETIRTATAQKVAQVIDENLLRDLSLTMSGEDQEEQIIAAARLAFQKSQTPHIRCANFLRAIANYEKSNLRSCILEALNVHGYEVNLVQGLSNQNIKELVQDATEDVKRQNCHDIFTAEDIPTSQIDRPLAFDAGWLERCQLTKAIHKKRLPGIETTPRWSEDLLYKFLYEDRYFIDKQELFWLLNHPEAAKLLQQERYHSLMRHFLQEEHLALWKMKQRFSLINALREIGILELIENPDKIYTKDSPEIIAIWKKGQALKYKQVLGRSPGKQEYALRYVCRLLNMIGLAWSSKQVRQQSTLVRQYQLDRQLLNDPDRLVVLECIERKYQKYLSGELENLDWSAILERLNQTQKESAEKSAETTTEQEVEVDTHEPNNVYTPQASCVFGNNPEKSTLFDSEINPLDSEDSLKYIIEMLQLSDSADTLRQLLEISEFTPDRLNRAWRMLNADKRRQISIWAKQLKAERQEWDFDYVIEQIDRQIKRIGKTIGYWKQYLLEKYNVTSRLRLSDRQILEFWTDLQVLPGINEGKPAY